MSPYWPYSVPHIMYPDLDTLAGWVAVIVPIVAALAAGLAAKYTFQANRILVKTERERRLREVSLLVNKIDAAAADVNQISNQLIHAYERSEAMEADRRSGSQRGEALNAIEKSSGIQDQAVNNIKCQREPVKPLQQEAHDLIKDGLETLCDEQTTTHLLKLDGYLLRIERIRRIFDSNLASVEARNIGLETTG